MTQIIFILFGVLFFLGCFAQLIIYPFYWMVIYADIVCLSIIAFFIFMIVGFFVLKKYYRLDLLSITSLIGGGIVFLGVSAYIEATFYIEKVAEKKYHTKPKWVNINLSKWTYSTPFGSHHYGSDHAVIVINEIWYHWSFEKRDFVND